MDVLTVKRSGWLAPAGLAFVAGFADAASFVGADGIFCAHVTGNFVVLAADLARHARADEWLKLATFPIFVLAVVATTSWAKRKAGSARSCMLTTATLLAAAAVTGSIVPVVHHTSGIGKSLVVGLLVLAMGVQNAMHRLHPKLGPMTTVMTGNVTGFLVDTVRAGSDPEKQRSGALVIAAFTLGCASGAFGVAGAGLASLVVPALVMWLVSRSQA